SSPRLLLFLSLAATAPPYPLSLHDALPISQILVHVVGADASMLARIIDVLKQLLPRQLHAAAHEPGQAAVLQGDVVLHAALAPELDANGHAAYVHVPGAQRGQAVGTIAACVPRVAYPNEGRFEERHHQRHDLLARQSGQGQVSLEVVAQLWQRLPELEHAFVLVAVAGFAPACMVTVLLAS